MSRVPCRQTRHVEALVIAQANLPARLAKHVQGCSACQAVRVTAAVVSELAASTVPPSALQDADELWQRARGSGAVTGPLAVGEPRIRGLRALRLAAAAGAAVPFVWVVTWGSWKLESLLIAPETGVMGLLSAVLVLLPALALGGLLLFEELLSVVE